MDEAGVAFPIVLRQGGGQGQVPLKVIVLGLDLVELLSVERLPQTASTVPERHLPLGLYAPELVEDVRPHRSHTGTAAYEDHFIVGVAGEELTERSGDRYLVALLETEN